MIFLCAFNVVSMVPCSVLLNIMAWSAVSKNRLPHHRIWDNIACISSLRCDIDYLSSIYALWPARLVGILYGLICTIVAPKQWLHSMITEQYLWLIITISWKFDVRHVYNIYNHYYQSIYRSVSEGFRLNSRSRDSTGMRHDACLHTRKTSSVLMSTLFLRCGVVSTSYRAYMHPDLHDWSRLYAELTCIIVHDIAFPLSHGTDYLGENLR